MGISRRELFRNFGEGAACLAVSNFIGLKGALGQNAVAAGGVNQEYDYRKWEDLYRKKWTWDKVSHSTHAVGCTAQCEWNVFVKDGIAFKEEQIEHPRSQNPELPDSGPQGCQRGACYTNKMYAPDRIKYPLKRIGKRGEGKWMRVSWEEALTEAADAMIDAIVKDQGARSIVAFWATSNMPPPWSRFYTLLGVILPDDPTAAGDTNMGYYATFGTHGFNGLPNSTPLFDSDLIFIWHWNPIYTWIPYYKEISQARYRGAQVITIAPDVNPSTVHADYWIPVEPGTDIALALGMCQVIVEEKLYKPGFLKEQTDLPFLVREDTQKFLRQGDMEAGGKDNQFYIYDLKAKKVVPARRDTLELAELDPALEGRYEVELAGGKKVQVRPVFDRLKEMLNKDYKPEQAAAIISRPFAKVHPDMIREVARKAGRAKTMAVTTRYNASKCYHVDLINRSIALFLVLSGHARPGGDPGSFGKLDGSRGTAWEIFQDMEKPDVDGGMEAFEKYLKPPVEDIMREDPTMTITMAQRELEIRQAKKAQPLGSYQPWVPGWQWSYYRAGFKERWDNKKWHDPHYRDFPSYVEEANKEGWFDGYIGPDKEKGAVRDRVLFEAGGNTMRRMPGSKVIFESYIPSLEKIISVDNRLSTTGLHADIVLPCASYYEQTRVITGNGWLLDKAVDPPGEVKTDWDICCLLARKISERAKKRGVGKVYDARQERTLELDKLYDRFTINGAYREGSEEKIADMMYRVGAKVGIYTEGSNLEEIRKANGIPARTVTSGAPLAGAPTPSAYGTPIVSAITPHRSNANTPTSALNKETVLHPTLTRRMQFYLDHDWFIEAGEALPVHRPHPLLGGDYPFHQTGGHGRESIHTIWITNPLILRLTRGVPSLFMNKETAERMGITDFEEVEVYNDSGLYRVRVKHSALMRPNQVAIYHCWESYQLSKGHWEAVNPGIGKPLLLAGGYGHLNYSQQKWQPGAARRGARVDIRKISV